MSWADDVVFVGARALRTRLRGTAGNGPVDDQKARVVFDQQPGLRDPARRVVGQQRPSAAVPVAPNRSADLVRNRKRRVQAPAPQQPRARPMERHLRRAPSKSAAGADCRAAAALARHRARVLLFDSGRGHPSAPVSPPPR